MPSDWIITDDGIRCKAIVGAYWSEGDAERDHEGHTRQATIDDLRWVREVHVT